jgi:protein O-mannosyl-transferase
VSGNPDVYQPDVAWADLWKHDYWGNDLANEGGKGWTHHSWRPAVVATFRLDWQRGGGDVWHLHVTNLVIHAASCVAAAVAFAAIAALATAALAGGQHEPAGAREPGAAVDVRTPTEGGCAPTRVAVARLASLLFALHPIHSECVANITSRADPAAAIPTFLALAAYAFCGRRALDATASASIAAFWRLCSVLIVVAGLIGGLLCKETSLVLPMLCACLDTAAAIVRLWCWGLRAARPWLPATVVQLVALAAVAWSTYYLRIVIMAKG